MTPEEILTLPPNAVVVFRGLELDDPELLSAALKATGRSDVLIIDLGETESSIEILDETQMAEHGWVRAKA